ncbi:E3 ubiquitin-protein ligase TRIM69 [Amia ocellicauda]|uniref:E3 ubiquitin-protein ligase TRIM69 n=1 Tax=Amia ocellicauda TaxID=2972642 RepID=UPI0034644CF1
MQSGIALDEELICAVCHDIFVEPVTLPCGHNFCETCVQQLKKMSLGRRRKLEFTCPLCLAPCDTRIHLKKNVVLHNIIEKYHQLHLSSGSGSGDIPCSVCKGQQRLPAEKSCVSCGESYCTLHVMPHLENEFFRQHVLVKPTTDTSRLCKEHGKDLELYCKTDRTPLCVYCMLPAEAEHLAGHDVVKLGETVNIVKADCQATLASIKESCSEVTASLLKMEESVSFAKEDLKRQQYTGFLNKIKLFLTIEEEAWQKRFSVDMMLDSRRIKCKVENLKLLQGRLQEAKEALEKALILQDPLTLLQLMKTADWSDLFQREVCSSKIQKVMDSVNSPSSIFKRRPPVFGSLAGVFPGDEIKLDPKTAHPQLQLSEECTAVCVTCDKHVDDNNSERFSSSYCVLGSNAFKRGLHYWEVTVRDLASWALGIAYHSISRDPPGCNLGSDDKSWALSYSDSTGQLCAQHDQHVFSFTTERAPEKIGLFLDKDSGIFSFYNADVLKCLYTFYCDLKWPVFPVFCPKLVKDGKFVSAAMKIENPGFV